MNCDFTYSMKLPREELHFAVSLIKEHLCEKDLPSRPLSLALGAVNGGGRWLQKAWVGAGAAMAG
jgi:hypothetical protein